MKKKKKKRKQERTTHNDELELSAKMFMTAIPIGLLGGFVFVYLKDVFELNVTCPAIFVILYAMTATWLTFKYFKKNY